MSTAVTVTVAAPTAIPCTVTTPPATPTTTRAESDEMAAYSSESPSGSAKWAATSISVPSPTNTLRSSIAPTVAGARFGTVTPKSCAADRPQGSRAVTVTVRLPLARPPRVSVLPDKATATRVASDEAAEYWSESRSGSAKYGATSSTAALSTSSSLSPIVPTATGARFGTVTPKLCPASRPSGSRAATVTVALPTAVPVTVTVLPERASVARVASDEAAEYSRSSPSGSAKYAARSNTSTLST